MGNRGLPIIYGEQYTWAGSPCYVFKPFMAGLLGCFVFVGFHFIRNLLTVKINWLVGSGLHQIALAMHAPTS